MTVSFDESNIENEFKNTKRKNIKRATPHPCKKLCTIDETKDATLHLLVTETSPSAAAETVGGAISSGGQVQVVVSQQPRKRNK